MPKSPQKSPRAASVRAEPPAVSAPTATRAHTVVTVPLSWPGRELGEAMFVTHGLSGIAEIGQPGAVGTSDFSGMVALEARVAALEHRLAIAPMQATIASLAGYGLDVLKPIPVTIRPDDDGYIASFFDAGLSMAGDTATEAFENLRGWIADSFGSLSAMSEANLGPGPLTSLRVLREFVQRP